MNELKAETIYFTHENGEAYAVDMYLKSEADKVIAEKDKEITELKADNERLKYEKRKMYKKRKMYTKMQHETIVDALCREHRQQLRAERRALWLARAERYKMIEFIAREEGNLCNQMSWSQYLRKRTYNQWVDQLLRIANLANKLHNKCRAKAEQYK